MFRLNPNLILHPFMCINSSQYEMRVTEINDCERGQTFTIDHIRGGLGLYVLFVLLMFKKTSQQWVPQLSCKTVTCSAVALLIPGDCLAVPFSSSNASSHNNHAWLGLQCSRDEWTGLFSEIELLTITCFLLSMAYLSLLPFISIYEGGSASRTGRDLRCPWDEKDTPHSSCLFPEFKRHLLPYRKKCWSPIVPF